jgi:predicted MFS family arabinose efflux permease
VLEGASLFAYAIIVLVSVPETRPPTADGGAHPAIDLRPVARDGALAALAVVVLLVGIGFFQLFTSLPLAMAADGISERYFGFVVSVNGALIVLIGLPVAAWVGNRATRWPVPVAVALIAVGMAFQIPAHTFVAYAACAVVWTLGEMAFLPVVPTLVARLAPPSLRGSYQGVYHASWGLAKMLGPALGGLVFAAHGSSALWAAAAGLAALAAVGMALLLPTLRRRFGEVRAVGDA